MDLFGNVPLVTEIQFELPTQASRSEIFQFVESELLDLETKLSDSRAVDYGRVDKDAASALLTRLYLNAEVYTGEARYNDVIAKAESIMSSSHIASILTMEIIMEVLMTSCSLLIIILMVPKMNSFLYYSLMVCNPKLGEEQHLWSMHQLVVI
ncbi:MAG: hypothetical protein CM15mP32_6090 [Flavobacteriaceae bacterium]|nr:MAG: hypothetical protein CM15mP32_6090 [Flavobacteriaceae bacterium]